MAKAVSSSSARFRQRKISTKQVLQILYQADIPDLEEEQPRDLQQIETGVEKGEEEEHHLQAAINASKAASAGAKVEQVYIPTPDASKRWPEYEKYYQKSFQEPTSYIRLSATVEDTAGCPYNMDEVDEEFLIQLNEKSEDKCSEDEFEMICNKLESVVSERQPFLSMDPSQIMPLDELSPIVIQQIIDAENDPTCPEFLLASTMSSIYKPHSTKSVKNNDRSQLDAFKLFAKKIYPHWKARKVERDGKSIFPSLKFEEGSGGGVSGEKDDNDPYVCFRRRELRQVRKTRRTDQQSTERLRKLQAEMEAAKKLMEMVSKRELLRKEALKLEWDIFEQRCKVKTVKRRLGVKGEDEDLVAHKKKKPLPEEEVKRPSTTSVIGSSTLNNLMVNGSIGSLTGSPNSIMQSIPANIRLPASKIPDMELVSLDQVYRDKENAIKTAVKTKLKSRSQADRDWVNYTDNPFVPYCDYFEPDPNTRQPINVVDEKYANYSSVIFQYPPSVNVQLKLPLQNSLGSSYASRVESNPIILRAEFEPENDDLKVLAKIDEKEMVGKKSEVPRGSAVSLRKRLGRGGRVIIDRRGLIRKHNAISEQVEQGFIGENCSRERFQDRYKFDSDLHTDNMDFPGSEPSRLNGISDETQSVRFGSMLLSKAYDCYRESYQQRQQQLLALQQKALQQQQEQQQQEQQQEQQQQQQQAQSQQQLPQPQQRSQTPTSQTQPPQVKQKQFPKQINNKPAPTPTPPQTRVEG